MPPRATELTPAQIKGLKHPGGGRAVKIAVGGVSGLHVQIQPSGAKSWVLRTRYGDWTERRDADGEVIERGRKSAKSAWGLIPTFCPVQRVSGRVRPKPSWKRVLTPSQRRRPHKPL